MLFGKTDEILHQPIVLNMRFLLFDAEGPLHHIEHITRYLGSQHGKIVGNNNKHYSQEKPVPVFPEKYIKRF